MPEPYETLEGVWSGIPLFPGSRVPVSILLDCLENDISLDEFLNSYKQVSPESVEAFLWDPVPPLLRNAQSPI